MKRLPKTYTLPSIDISQEADRRVIIARGTKNVYQGHPTTVLLPDGRTMYCVWTYDHGGPCGPLKRSDDGGKTWSRLLKVPANWRTIRNCPSIYRLVDPHGTARLVVFVGGNGTGSMWRAVSEDDGATWSPMERMGIPCIMPICGIAAISGGRHLGLWHEGRTIAGRRQIRVYQGISEDGGLTWGDVRVVCAKRGADPCEAELVRSPDGRQLAALMRENSRNFNSLVMFSDNDGRTWTKPRELPAALTGDRHKARYLPDGRLVVVFRDMCRMPTGGHFVGWVGTYDDIVAGREGQYRVKLLHSFAGCDTGYPGLEVLGDETIVATTYCKIDPGPRKHSVLSVRFRIDEIDAKAAELAKRTYNGIVQPAAWPPVEKLTRRPQRVPYLKRPPKPIRVGTERQLFVDDFLIEHTTLKRTSHRAKYHPGCPVLTATRPWEKADGTFWAAPFSDGVWRDPADGTFKLWYLAGRKHTCYAESTDGVRWRKPKLDARSTGSGQVVPGTNIVLSEPRDSSTVWLDANDPNPRRRWKMLYLGLWKKRWALILRYSPDGIHWSRRVAVEPVGGDRSTMFHNPFRGRWVLSLRNGKPGMGRIRHYREHEDLVAGLADCDANSVPWLGADSRDPHHPNPAYSDITPQLYNFDAAAYESIVLGEYSVWMGPENNVSRQVGNHKRCEIFLGFSRDGFHFDRPDRTPFMGVNEVRGAWNWGNVQSAGGPPILVGDELYFYCSGRALDPTGNQGRMATGLATIRRDGFASMDAGARAGTLTTRPIVFGGRDLYVNAAIGRGGSLAVEVLDTRGNVIPPLTGAECVPVRSGGTSKAVTWKRAPDMLPVRSLPVRLRFTLRKARLYAFGVGGTC